MPYKLNVGTFLQVSTVLNALYRLLNISPVKGCEGPTDPLTNPYSLMAVSVAALCIE